MNPEELAEQHAEWYSKLCKRVYKEAWKHAYKHCLEEIKTLWDENDEAKKFGDKLYEILEKEGLSEK